MVCEKLDIVSFACSKIKNIIALIPRYPPKLICCIALGSA